MLKNNLINFLNENEYDYLLVNSTNEFLVEYNELEHNARYYLTGFSGSTGEALLSKDGNVSLFVDGRYHEQADKQVYDGVEVVKLTLGQSFLSSFVDKIESGKKLAIVANKVSLSFFEGLFNALKEKNVEFEFLDFDPVFEFVDKKPYKLSTIMDVPIEIAGKSADEKLAEIQLELKADEAIIISNLEQIAWILNKRAFSQNFSSSFKAKLIIEKNSYKLFLANQLDEYFEHLNNTNKKFLYSAKSLSLGDYLLVKDRAEGFLTDKIEKEKAIKNETELTHMASCFERTDNVVKAVSKLVNNADSLTEQEIVNFVENEFFAQGATSLSFNTIVASGKNSALAHYAPDMDKITPIASGDFILLDCGAYFEGGYSTDITRVFCMGKPSEEAKKVYTTVLKANLNAYHITIKDNLSGFDIDAIARDIIMSSDLDGYNFNHGTGHGVGIGVHEFPPSISKSELAKKSLENGMVFTIEPGAYNPDFGGVRLENTVFFKDGKIVSFSKMPFEEKLIDYSLLNEQEKIWLNEWQKGIV